MSDAGYQIICTKCRWVIPAGLDACPHCGQRLGFAPAGTPRHFFGGAVPRTVGGPPAAATAAQTAPVEELRASTDRYAGFWIRAAAILIDGLILLAPLYVIERAWGGTWTGAIAPAVLNWLYFTYMESSPGQATFGKALLGLAVTDYEGRRISFRRANARYFAKILSALAFLIGYLMVGWTEHKQGLHDLIASTLVFRR